jgi:hypothetical protein
MDEMNEIESQHIQSLSLILEYAHRIRKEWMVDNPIEMKKNEHGVEYELPDGISMAISGPAKELIK